MDIPSTSVIAGKLYSRFNMKLLEFLIASYIPYCGNFTAELRSVSPRQQVTRLVTYQSVVVNLLSHGISDKTNWWRVVMGWFVTDRHGVSPSSARLSFW